MGIWMPETCRVIYNNKLLHQVCASRHFHIWCTDTHTSNAEGFLAVLLDFSTPYRTVVTAIMFRQVQLCFVFKSCPTHKTLLVKTHRAVGYRITECWRPPEFQQGSGLVRNDWVNVGKGGQFLRYFFRYLQMSDLLVASDTAHPV